MNKIYNFSPGDTPLLISIPHCGTTLPEDLASRLTDAGRLRADTDWHVDRLYEFAAGLGAGVIAATHSRYVIDLNRPPDGAALYPGADNTELCPTTTFAREALYVPGEAPDEAEIERRVAQYWRPYHDALSAEIERLRKRHGVALLFDAHSIRSVVPRFFEGRLPDFNLGTAGGAAADETLAARCLEVCSTAEGYSAVLNGRFTGGYITRRHGRPKEGIHAVQLELSQATYMDEDPPFDYRPDLARPTGAVLGDLLAAMSAWLEAEKPK